MAPPGPPHGVTEAQVLDAAAIDTDVPEGFVA
jgi:hypothetical protein